MWVKISQKKINFPGLKSHYLFIVKEIMVPKYGQLMLPGAFPDQITPVIDFTDEAVVYCDVPVVTIFL